MEDFGNTPPTVTNQINFKMNFLSIPRAVLFITLIVFAAFTTSCMQEQVSPARNELRINGRSDYSGLEEYVKIKVSERDQIPVSSILTCVYEGITSEGFGKYTYTTSDYSGIYLITGIIGEEIDE